MKSDDRRFRDHVDYCRLEAEKSVDPADKKAWLKVAGDWLKMAEQARRYRDQDFGANPSIAGLPKFPLHRRMASVRHLDPIFQELQRSERK